MQPGRPKPPVHRAPVPKARLLRLDVAPPPIVNPSSVISDTVSADEAMPVEPEPDMLPEPPVIPLQQQQPKQQPRMKVPSQRPKSFAVRSMHNNPVGDMQAALAAAAASRMQTRPQGQGSQQGQGFQAPGAGRVRPKVQGVRPQSMMIKPKGDMAAPPRAGFQQQQQQQQPQPQPRQQQAPDATTEQRAAVPVRRIPGVAGPAVGRPKPSVINPKRGVMAPLAPLHPQQQQQQHQQMRPGPKPGVPVVPKPGMRMVARAKPAVMGIAGPNQGIKAVGVPKQGDMAHDFTPGAPKQGMMILPKLGAGVMPKRGIDPPLPSHTLASPPKQSVPPVPADEHDYNSFVDADVDDDGQIVSADAVDVAAVRPPPSDDDQPPSPNPDSFSGLLPHDALSPSHTDSLPPAGADSLPHGVEDSLPPTLTDLPLPDTLTPPVVITFDPEETDGGSDTDELIEQPKTVRSALTMAIGANSDRKNDSDAFSGRDEQSSTAEDKMTLGELETARSSAIQARNFIRAAELSAKIAAAKFAGVSQGEAIAGTPQETLVKPAIDDAMASNVLARLEDMRQRQRAAALSDDFETALALRDEFSSLASTQLEAIRESQRAAAAAEDFETAQVLRDKAREIEALMKPPAPKSADSPVAGPAASKVVPVAVSKGADPEKVDPVPQLASSPGLADKQGALTMRRNMMSRKPLPPRISPHQPPRIPRRDRSVPEISKSPSQSLGNSSSSSYVDIPPSPYVDLRDVNSSVNSSVTNSPVSSSMTPNSNRQSLTDIARTSSRQSLTETAGSSGRQSPVSSSHQSPSSSSHQSLSEPINADISFEADGRKISCGTLSGLVNYLIAPTNADASYRFQFFFTYRAFCSPKELLEQLTLAFVDNDDDIVRFKIIGVLQYWVETYWLDFSDTENTDGRPLADEVEDFVKEAVAAFMPQQSKTLQALIVRMRTTGKTVYTNAIDSSQAPKPLLDAYKDKRAAKLGMMDSAVSVSANFTLLHAHPEEFARQITLVEHSLFAAVEPWELSGLDWGKVSAEADITHVRPVLKLIAAFNNASNWAKCEILSEQSSEGRALIIERLIEIATICSEKLQNFNTALEICSALNAAEIGRLSRSWLSVSAKSRKKLETISSLMSTNFKLLREKIAYAEPPLLPYIGMYLSDLTMINENSSLTSESTTERRVINFSKFRQMADTFEAIRKAQIKAYIFTPVPFIQAIFKVPPTCTNDRELYDWSLKVEPRDGAGNQVKSPSRGKPTSNRSDAAIAFGEGEFTRAQMLAEFDVAAADGYATLLSPAGLGEEVFTLAESSVVSFGQAAGMQTTIADCVQLLTSHVPVHPRGSESERPIRKRTCSVCAQMIEKDFFHCINCTGSVDICHICVNRGAAHEEEPNHVLVFAQVAPLAPAKSKDDMPSVQLAQGQTLIQFGEHPDWAMCSLCGGTLGDGVYFCCLTCANGETATTDFCRNCEPFISFFHDRTHVIARLPRPAIAVPHHASLGVPCGLNFGSTTVAYVVDGDAWRRGVFALLLAMGEFSGIHHLGRSHSARALFRLVTARWPVPSNPFPEGTPAGNRHNLQLLRPARAVVLSFLQIWTTFFWSDFCSGGGPGTTGLAEDLCEFLTRAADECGDSPLAQICGYISDHVYWRREQPFADPVATRWELNDNFDKVYNFLVPRAKSSKADRYAQAVPLVAEAIMNLTLVRESEEGAERLSASDIANNYLMDLFSRYSASYLSVEAQKAKAVKNEDFAGANAAKSLLACFDQIASAAGWDSVPSKRETKSGSILGALNDSASHDFKWATDGVSNALVEQQREYYSCISPLKWFFAALALARSSSTAQSPPPPEILRLVAPRSLLLTKATVAALVLTRNKATSVHKSVAELRAWSEVCRFALAHGDSVTAKAIAGALKGHPAIASLNIWRAIPQDIQNHILFTQQSVASSSSVAEWGKGFGRRAEECVRGGFLIRPYETTLADLGTAAEACLSSCPAVEQTTEDDVERLTGLFARSLFHMPTVLRLADEIAVNVPSCHTRLAGGFWYASGTQTGSACTCLRASPDDAHLARLVVSARQWFHFVLLRQLPEEAMINDVLSLNTSREAALVEFLASNKFAPKQDEPALVAAAAQPRRRGLTKLLSRAGMNDSSKQLSGHDSLPLDIDQMNYKPKNPRRKSLFASKSEKR